MKKEKLLYHCIIIAILFISICTTSIAQETLSYYLKDRGTGVPTSMFGTYINKGEIIFYPFYEFYYDQDTEYSPQEFGYWRFVAPMIKLWTSDSPFFAAFIHIACSHWRQFSQIDPEKKGTNSLNMM